MEFRRAQGSIRSRTALLQVKGIGPKSFEQAVGFVRVRGGGEPLDEFNIHPESYINAKIIASYGLDVLQQPDVDMDAGVPQRKKARRTAPTRVEEKKYAMVINLCDDDEADAEEADQEDVEMVDVFSSAQSYMVAAKEVARMVKENPSLMSSICQATSLEEIEVRRILTELQRPGHDMRTDLPPLPLEEITEAGEDGKSGVQTIDDLVVGEVYPGTIRNVTTFGCFIDIGIGQDVLMHTQGMARRHGKGGRDNSCGFYTPGRAVRVVVKKIDEKRGRVSVDDEEKEKETRRDPRK